MTIDLLSISIGAKLPAFDEGLTGQRKAVCSPILEDPSASLGRIIAEPRPRRLTKHALFVPIMTGVFLSWTASSNAGEPDPGELVSMLDHAAIVETMVSACENSRPDLAKPFREAEQLWWVRNAQIHETLASLEREIGTPRAKAFLDYFSTLQRSLRQQIEEERHIGNAGYAARCDGVLEDLTHGRLDYRSSAGASGAG